MIIKHSKIIKRSKRTKVTKGNSNHKRKTKVIGLLSKLKTGVVKVMGRLRNALTRRKQTKGKRTKKSTK